MMRLRWVQSRLDRCQHRLARVGDAVKTVQVEFVHISGPAFPCRARAVVNLPHVTHWQVCVYHGRWLLLSIRAVARHAQDGRVGGREISRLNVRVARRDALGVSVHMVPRNFAIKVLNNPLEHRIFLGFGHVHVSPHTTSNRWVIEETVCPLANAQKIHCHGMPKTARLYPHSIIENADHATSLCRAQRSAKFYPEMSLGSFSENPVFHERNGFITHDGLRLCTGQCRG